MIELVFSNSRSAIDACYSSHVDMPVLSRYTVYRACIVSEVVQLQMRKRKLFKESVAFFHSMNNIIIIILFI